MHLHEGVGPDRALGRRRFVLHLHHVGIDLERVAVGHGQLGPGREVRAGEDGLADAEVVEAGWHLADTLRLSANYAYLHATQPTAAGQVEEIRRPRHSGSVSIDGTADRLTYGVSLAYVGTHTDTNFNVFPFQTVHLSAYWLAGARVSYEVRHNLELFVRGSNLLNQHYQDVLDYHTAGRAIFAGIRFASPVSR